MILAVDIGNSATKVALVSGERVTRRSVIDARAGDRAIAATLARTVGDARTLEAVALSSVRPRATDAMVRAVVRATGLFPVVVNHRTAMPIDIAVRYPARVGADRLCAACGAIRGSRRDAIVITVGSAITVNLVLDRTFLGGVIMPGPVMSLAAMHAFTAKLPALDLGATAPRRFDDTESAMRWGALLAGSGGIEKAVDMLDRRARRRLPRVITGGDAGPVARSLPRSYRLEPDLTLLGLARIGRTK